MTQTIDWYVVEGSNVKGRNIKVICEAENPHEAMKTARNYGITTIRKWRITLENYTRDSLIDSETGIDLLNPKYALAR